MPIYFAMIPNAWGTSPESAEEALAQAKIASRRAPNLKREAHYVLVFPDDTELDVNSVTGGWTSTHKPTAIAIAHRLTPETYADLEHVLEPKEATP